MCWVFFSHSLHYPEQPDRKKTWTQGKSELSGAGTSSVQGQSAEERQSTEQWEMMGMNPAVSVAAPLRPSGHLLVHTAARELSCDHLCALGGDTQISLGIQLCDCKCCLALPRRAQGALAVLTLQPPFHLQPL